MYVKLGSLKDKIAPKRNALISIATCNCHKSESVRIYYESSAIILQNSSKLQCKREGKISGIDIIK